MPSDWLDGHMRYLKLVIAYDGTQYVGWQLQNNGLSIQACLEKAWLKITGEPIRISASGRTDAGVHARGQVCSLRTQSEIETRILQRALNANLPRDIIVLDVTDAPEGFHAINWALRKTYRYQLQSGSFPDVFYRAFSWHVPRELNVAAMQKAAVALVGCHDFRSFQTAGSDRRTTVRTVERLDITEQQSGPFQYVTLEITADGFLYNMVRSITGTLVKVGQGKHPVEWVEKVLRACDRTLAGPTAPPQGLFLWHVEYSPDCPKKTF